MDAVKTRLDEISAQIKNLEAEITKFEKQEKFVKSHFKLLVMILGAITIAVIVLMICKYIVVGIFFFIVMMSMEIWMYSFGFKENFRIDFQRRELIMLKKERTLLMEKVAAVQKEDKE